MREIVRKNQIIYNYEIHKLSIGVIHAIILYVLAVLLFLIAILISYLYLGEAPAFVGGIGVSSILCNMASMVNIILEVHLYRNFHAEIRTMLVLQLIFFTMWIFII